MVNRALDTAKRAALYRQAASDIEDGGYVYACLALPHHERQVFTEFFYPEAKDYWPRKPGVNGWWGTPNKRTQRMRVVALCFMAAMVERGDAWRP